jgi:hypothetical protein
MATVETAMDLGITANVMGICATGVATMDGV